MGKVNIQHSMEVNASASKAWEIIGTQFVKISEWAPGVLKSQNNAAAPQKFADAPTGGRICEVSGMGTVTESIVHFDAKHFEISWTATAAKIPGFVKGLQNAAKVEAIDATTCRISMNLTAELTGILGFLMGAPLKSNFNKTILSLLKGWKSYAETGQVNASKQRDLAKLAQS